MKYSDLFEGGNLKLQTGEEAQRIDLTSLNRSEVVKTLFSSLTKINQAFDSFTGLPLWNKSLLSSKEFLSGSAFHFFDTKNIDDVTFTGVKPSVGDIDTQVDISLENEIREFLKVISGKTFGDLTFVGFKESAGQFITLWNSKSFNQNIQIDFELVDYASGKPTTWANFSHSSSWEDLQLGVKGVFQKYLLRALDARNLKTVGIRKKTGVKETKATELAFSVQHGLRRKLVPAKDERGLPIIANGIPVFDEIPTKDGNYITDLNVMFEMFFGEIPTEAQLKQFSSFIGIAELVKKYYNKSERSSVLAGFAWTLWGKGAQSLYRDDETRDHSEKMKAFEILSQKLGVSETDEIKGWRKDYYKA